MLARKLACPSCSARLKVEETLAAGTKIKCPKCGMGFAVPALNGHTEAPTPATPAKKARKAAPPPPKEEDLDEDELDEEPEPKKFRKKKKKAGGGALVWGLIIGAVLLVGGGAGAAVWWFNSEKKETAVAANAAANSAPSTPATQAERRRSRGDEDPTERPPQPTQTPAEQPPSGMTSGQSAPPAGPGFFESAMANMMKQGAGGMQQAAKSATPASSAGNGRAVYQAQNCARCHQDPGGNAGGMAMGRGRNRGPNLSAVGRDPTHTVGWLMEHVRNPKSHRPESSMPPYEGKINETDLRALAEYLASLKG